MQADVEDQGILITGATDGIGRALAQALRARGRRPLVLGSRPFERVDDGDLDAADYARVDLSQPDCGARARAFVDQRGARGLELLVHCAGVGDYGPFDQQPDERIEALVDVNLSAPIDLTHALLPLLEAAHGRIVFVSSVVAAHACPQYGAYAATKAALDGFARSLRVELEGSVEVQVLHPGATRTAIHEKSGMPREVADWDRFPSPESTARRILEAIDGGGRGRAIGTPNRLLYALGHNLAAPLDWLQRKRAKR